MTSVGPYELVYLDPVALQEGLHYSKLKRRQNKEEASQRSLRHEQRRRRFLRQQDTAQQRLAKEYFENEVVGQLLNKSVCEQQEDELRDVVLSYKELIPTNRKNRQLQMDAFRQLEENFDSSWELAQADREKRWVVYLDHASQNSRRNRLLNANIEAVRYDTVSFVQGFLDEVVDAVIWTATCREVGVFDFTATSDDPADLEMHFSSMNANKQDFPPIPSLIFHDLKNTLVSPHPSTPELPNLHAKLVSSLLVPFNIAQRPCLADKDWLLKEIFSGRYIFGTKEDQGYAEYLAEQDWAEYVERRNAQAEALPAASRPGALPSEPKEAIARQFSMRVGDQEDAVLTPSWVITQEPRHLLGETVAHLRVTLQPIAPQPAPRVDTTHLKFRAALFGVSRRMKERVSRACQQLVPRLTLISAEDAVHRLLATETPDPLADQLRAQLASGHAVSDSVYVKLIVREIEAIPAHNSNGFLLVDFPSSLEQLLLLMEAISGIRYDAHRPQINDHVSPLCPIVQVPETFDIAQCGLDSLLYCDVAEVAVGSALQERINARKDLTTQEVVFIDPTTTESVRGLTQVYDPSYPVHAVALHATTGDQQSALLQQFCAGYHMLRSIEGAVDEQVKAFVASVAKEFVPAERMEEEFWVRAVAEHEHRVRMQKEAEESTRACLEAENVHVEVCHLLAEDVCAEEIARVGQAALEEEVAASAPPDPAAAAAAGAITAPAVVPEAVPVPRLPQQLSVAQLHPMLASALGTLWQRAEDQSVAAAASFFTSMRDVRLQILQRRRLCMDSVQACMMKLDDRQELFNVFRTEFNAVEEDLRFDPDAIAMLHCRTLVFRDALAQLCDERRAEVQILLEDIAGDNNVKVLVHRVLCEAAFFLQSEFGRFYAALQLLHDCCKAYQGFEIKDRIFSELELLAPLMMEGYVAPEAPPKPVYTSAGKDKGKKEPEKKGKDKDATPVGREVLAPYLLHTTPMLHGIPTARTREPEIADPKSSKGKGKDKKGAAEEQASTNPFQDLEAAVLVDLGKWKQGAYACNRELFEGDEALCSALEAAVWFEAEKMEASVRQLREYVDQHVTLLEGAEAQQGHLLATLAHDRYVRELTAGERVVDMVEACIANAEPLEMVWLVAPDACTPVAPATLWKRWRYLVPFMWAKQYEKGLKRRFRKLMSKQGGMASVVNAAMSVAGMDLSGSKFDPTIPLSDSDDESNPSARGSRPPSKRGNSANKAASKLRGGSAKRPMSATPKTRAGSAEGHVLLHSTGGARPPSAEDSWGREHARYMEERHALEQRLKVLRESREREFRELGMSPSAAKLAAFNELLIEEQHKMADLDAAWKSILARAKSAAAKKGTH